MVAAATAIVLGMVAAAAVAYQLLDILLLLFLGVVVAAALQPWHGALCRRGVPKGLAVLLIYLFLLMALALMALVVGPVVVDQIGTFISELPQGYAGARASLLSSSSASMHFLGQRLPPFERLAPALSDLAPQIYSGTLGVTTSIVKLPVYFITVLAVGFYWTMELPRFERLLLSLITVERRPRALNVWHEIESRLGGYMRGQGLAMLFVGAASAAGYALIGLPNVLALGVLAGLLEAVPLIGPLLAVAPAVLIALPIGGHSVMLVVGMALALHLIEANILIPRIMHHAVGVSALVSLVAVMAFGTLYGVAGVLIAIPIAAVLQVLLDAMVVNVEPSAVNATPTQQLRGRVRSLRQQARARLRARGSRMGIDPASADHVVDAVDQEIEAAAARAESLGSLAGEAADPLATLRFEEAVHDVEALAEAAQDAAHDAAHDPAHDPGVPA